ncbi:MAG TPA: DUF1800 family protein, partial [Saprospiraceae bacterium]|nr:DUF1800 family protein [Saprospiraceae bacterium]
MMSLTDIKLIAMKHFTLLLLNTFLFTMYTSVAQKFPYKAEGLSERQAAEHLLSRFTFGVRSSDIDEAVKMGLEQWFEHQLVGEIADVDLQNRLESLPALKMTNREIVEQYPLGPQLRNLAIKEGLLDKNDIGSDDKEKLKQAYSTLHEKYGIQSSKELERQTVNQKIIRAIYSKNQLHEVLTDFWFNHFNV